MCKTFILFLLAGTAGFAQSPPSLLRLGEAVQTNNVDFLWKATSNGLPQKAWVYRVLPKTFPPETISKLVAHCGFTQAQGKLVNGTDWVFKNADSHPSKQLTVSHGSIFYNAVIRYGPTNMAQDVPSMSQLPELTTNFVSSLGISLSDIEKNDKGSPNFHFWEPTKEYFLPGKIVTNIEFRAVGFSRAVDGISVIGAGTVGDCQIHFGEHGSPVHIELSWRDLKQYKQYEIVSPEVLIKRIHGGKAVQGPIPMNLPPLDWRTIKSVTVENASLRYYAGDQMAPSQWLIPIVSLWTTLDTPEGNVPLEIFCPAIK